MTTVTTIRPRRGRARSRADQAQALAQLPKIADKIRYGCEVAPAPVTTDSLRAWLAARGVETDSRHYVSRILNDWRRTHGEPPPTPAGGIAALVPDETDSTPPPAEPEPQPQPQPQPQRDAGPETEVDSDPAVVEPTETPTGQQLGGGPMVGAVPVAPEVAEPVAPEGTSPGTVAHPVAVEVADVLAHTTPVPAAAVIVPAGVPVSVADTVAVTATDPKLLARSRRVRIAAYSVLAVVAVAGASLSYRSLEMRATRTFPTGLAHMFPLLVDALIVGASLAYLAGAILGHGRPGWRLTAHTGVAGTLALNWLASPNLADVPWHIAAPIVWSILVEMVSRDLLGDYRAQHAVPDSLPLALWVTAPRESFSTFLRVRRQAAHATARVDVGVHAAAAELLRMALPRTLAGRRARRIISRQLRAGSISPQIVQARTVALMGDVQPGTAQAIVRDILASAIAAPKPPAGG